MILHNQRKFSDEELLALIKKHPNMSNTQLGKLLGVCEASIRRRKRVWAAQGIAPECDWVKPVPEGYHIKGVSQYCDAKGNVIRQWVKSDKDREDQLEALRAACEAFTEDLPKYTPTLCQNKDIDADLMLVLPIGDLHVGMASWRDETGNDWGIEHVKVAVFHVFKMLIENAPNVSKILIINLGDFGHRDGKNAVTPQSGHQLDVDGRYPLMIRTCILLLRYIIELAAKKAPIVEVKNVGGNHDYCSGIIFSECLSNVYENCPNIIIDISPAPVKYSEWGKVLIATTHGDTIPMVKLPGVVANDQSEMWGRTRFRYGMTGHIHSSNIQSKEFTGMEVESFRTLAPGDSFAAWYGWRSGQDAHGILFHKEFGRRGRNEIGIIMIKEYLDNL